MKLPRKGSFKSSLRKSPKKKPAGKKKSKEKEAKTFIIKPIPTANVHPVLVFINPKSGGNQVCFSFYKDIFFFNNHIDFYFIILFVSLFNFYHQKGAKLLQKFQWLLNPRQVFDLTQGGPNLGYNT